MTVLDDGSRKESAENKQLLVAINFEFILVVTISLPITKNMFKRVEKKHRTENYQAFSNKVLPVKKNS